MSEDETIVPGSPGGNPIEPQRPSGMPARAATPPPSAAGSDAHATTHPPLAPAASASGAGDIVIAKFRLLQRIGTGGMGEVYEAQKLDPIRRRVALKVIKRGMDTDAIVARFESERQALALMDHECIAKVFDAGATPDGRPYFEDGTPFE